MKRIVVLLLAAAMCLLTGCQSWQSGEYHSVKPHAGDFSQTEPMELSQVQNYQQILNALTDMAEDSAASCIMGVDQYEGDLQEDVTQAIAYATQKDPVGAYVFARVGYRIDRIGNKNVLILEPSFRHSRSDIEAVVRYGKAVEQKLADALDTFAPSLTLWISGYVETDFSQVVRDYCDENPDKAMEYPKVQASVYPDSGSSRVVELKFTYTTSRDTMWNMQGAVETIFSSAEGYVSLATDEYTKASRLCSFLTELFDYTQEESVTPAYSLLCQGVGDSRAYANVFAAMCRRAGLTCSRVDGTRNGEDWSWNVVQVDGYCTFVDLMAENPVQFRGDEQMPGYDWDRSAVPQCQPVWPGMAEAEPAAETVPETEETAEPESQETEPQETTEAAAEANEKSSR